MIDALIAGRLHGKPASRNSQAGKPLTVAKVRTPLADGDSVFISVIAFDAGTAAALLALDDGDSVALSGALTPKVWETKDGEHRPALDLVAHAVLTPYHVTRKRKASARPTGAGRNDDGLDDGGEPF